MPAAQHLGRKGIGSIRRAEDRLDAGSEGGAQHGAQVARVAHLVRDESQVYAAGSGRLSWVRTASRPCGVSVSLAARRTSGVTCSSGAWRSGEAIQHLTAALGQILGVKDQLSFPAGSQRLFNQAHPFNNKGAG